MHFHVNVVLCQRLRKGFEICYSVIHSSLPWPKRATAVIFRRGINNITTPNLLYFLYFQWALYAAVTKWFAKHGGHIPKFSRTGPLIKVLLTSFWEIRSTQYKVGTPGRNQCTTQSDSIHQGGRIAVFCLTCFRFCWSIKNNWSCLINIDGPILQLSNSSSEKD